MSARFHSMKTAYRMVWTVVIALVLFVVLCLAALTVLEYRPADEEVVIVEGEAVRQVAPGEELRLLSWNAGFGALGDNADFFMDGGTKVYPADEARVMWNTEGIGDMLASLSPDIVLLQEVDTDSARSYHIDQTEVIAAKFAQSTEEATLMSTFAYNFNCFFIPYPIPPVGRVKSGLLTLSTYAMEEATRIQLPLSFAWPVRTANLKRCLMVNRFPVAGSDKELVVINLHLEAYDSGEGKVAQTKALTEVLRTEAEAGNYVIAGGDFNQTFSDTDLSAFPVLENSYDWGWGIIDVEEIGEGFTCYMDETVPSCRALDKSYAGTDESEMQYYVIDGYIVSDNIEVSAFQTLQTDFVYTDHNPVLMTVTLR